MGNQAALINFLQVDVSGLLNKENTMSRIIKYFFLATFFLFNHFALAGEVKSWQDTQLVIVELNSDLKPIDKKEVTLEKPFNASNQIFKIEFSYFFDEKSLDRKFNIKADSVDILQKFSNPEQALNWATQIKLMNGKTYYFMINKINIKK